MKKRMLALFMAIMLCFSLTVCWGTDNDNPKISGSLVVYTVHPSDLMEDISEGFYEKTGVEVEFINLRSAIGEKIKSEKENPQADVMYGAPTPTFLDLKNADCFDQYEPAWAGDLKESYKDKDGYFYGTIQTPVMMFYNTEIMSEKDAPKDWFDLADPKYKDQIITRDSIAISMGTTVACIVDYLSQKESEKAAWKFWEDFDNNVKNYDNVSSLIMQAVGKGEAPIGISVLNDIMNNVVKNKLPLKPIYAKSGSVVIFDCVALIKGSKNPEAAKRFIDYVGSVEIQSKLAKKYMRMPTLDAAFEGAPNWMDKDVKALDCNWDNVTKNKQAWVDIWVENYINADKSMK